MRVGLTGAGGFVGRALVARLQSAGYEVIPIGRSVGEGEAGIAVGDLADPRLPTEVPALDVVVHLAARTHVAAELGSESVAAFRAVNVGGTGAMLHLAERAKARRFVFLSSIKVNGERTDGDPFSEIDRPRPEDAYGLSKLEAEELIRSCCPATGMDYVILRPPLIYGPAQKGNLRLLDRAISRGIPLPFGRVRNRRSMIYVANLVDLIAVALQHPRAANRTLIADDGTVLATPDLIRSIGEAKGRKARLLSVPLALLRMAGRLSGRSDQIDRLTGDLEIDGRATRLLLDWQPIVPPAEALATTFA